MIVKFLLLTCWAATLAQGDAHEEALTKLLAEGRVKVLQVDDRIRDPTEEYLELIEERRESLDWEHVAQKENVNATTTAIFFRGMLKNNRFSNFHCIAKAAWNALGKIENSGNNVQNTTELMLEGRLEEVRTLRLITLRLIDYVEDLRKRKLEELRKETKPSERDKIVEGARQKMKLLQTILAEVENKAKDIKFKFFEDYVKYSHDTETYLKKTAREGAQKALKCLS